jgi:pimeloyl-ACP methyl ester carboxylesterase
MQVVVNDILTSYNVNGSGKVVLLLHGWGDSSKTFKKLEKNLSTNYKVICLDLPGFGATATPNEAYSLRSYADFIRKFLSKIDESTIYAIIGHSNGGAIALKALSIKSLSCQKLILLASSGVRSSYASRKKVLRLAVKTAKIPTLLLSKSAQLKIKKHVYKKIGSDLFVAENMQETFKKIVSEDLINQLSAIDTDTLLIYGDKDTATPVEYGEKLANALIKSRLEIINGAGHFLHQTNFEQVNKLVEDFMVSHD